MGQDWPRKRAGPEQVTELSPTKMRVLQSYAPGPERVEVFGDRVLKEVIQVKQGHWGGP